MANKSPAPPYPHHGPAFSPPNQAAPDRSSTTMHQDMPSSSAPPTLCNFLTQAIAGIHRNLLDDNTPAASKNLTVLTHALSAYSDSQTGRQPGANSALQPQHATPHQEHSIFSTTSATPGPDNVEAKEAEMQAPTIEALRGIVEILFINARLGDPDQFLTLLMGVFIISLEAIDVLAVPGDEEDEGDGNEERSEDSYGSEYRYEGGEHGPGRGLGERGGEGQGDEMVLF